jgi:hypothetical protein
VHTPAASDSLAIDFTPHSSFHETGGQKNHRKEVENESAVAEWVGQDEEQGKEVNLFRIGDWLRATGLI